MCGINAIYDPAGRWPDKHKRVSYMNDQMRYRGPDDAGLYADAYAALGMRRLSIIDLSGGHQPLYNEDQSLVLVCNGEIYNYVELMRDLKARGHRFMSSSDTETILHLYEEKGEHCLDDLRGMFAFVLWDSRRQRLFAARDRIGIKPLYMARCEDSLWLSSELKAIVGAMGLTPTLRPTAVGQFLSYGYAIDQRNTMVDEVQRVLPGEYIVMDANGVTLTRYWMPRFGGDEGIVDRSDAEILATFDEAVQQHLRSDVPVGILLSSGIDSSAVAAFAAQEPGHYTALCAGYVGEPATDERPAAHQIANQLGLPYVDVLLESNDYGQYFDELIACVDEPVGDRAAMPQWALYKRSRELGYTVLLTGNGGDEIFFGYPFWNTVGQTASQLTDAERVSWTGLGQVEWVRRTRRLLTETAGADLLATFESIDEPLYALRSYAPWGPDAMASIIFGTYLVHNGCFLTDKLAMGCSIEARVPLLDHQLVDQVLALPLRQRFDPIRSKPLLRRILRGRLPEWVLGLPKRGFTPPIKYLDNLIRNQAQCIEQGVLADRNWLKRRHLHDLLRRQAAVPWLRPERVRRPLGIERSTDFLFRVLAFERWHSVVTNLPRFE